MALLAVLPTAFLFAAAAASADLRVQARVIAERQRVQTELPLAPAEPTPQPMPMPAQAPRAARGPDVEPSMSPPPVTIPLPSLQFLCLVCLAVVAALVLFWLFRRLASLQRDEELPPPPGRATATGRTRPRATSDADALAAQGRYADAIHALLLRALEDLGRRAARATSRALTAREVLRGAPLAEPGRAALGALVRAVEIVHFGGHDAVREDYDACADHYRRFQGTWTKTA
jgi:hypothetical protein